MKAFLFRYLDGECNQDDKHPHRKWWHWRGLPALGIASIITRGDKK